MIQNVWQLLDQAYQLFGPMPTLLERDLNIPPVAELLGELDQIRSIQNDHQDLTRTPARLTHA